MGLQGGVYDEQFYNRRERAIERSLIPRVAFTMRLAIGGIMHTDFIELARNCPAHSRITASPEVAAELRRIAEEYRKKAVDLEWENYAFGDE